jgi:hypothetical protein
MRTLVWCRRPYGEHAVPLISPEQNTRCGIRIRTSLPGRACTVLAQARLTRSMRRILRQTRRSLRPPRCGLGATSPGRSCSAQPGGQRHRSSSLLDERAQRQRTCIRKGGTSEPDATGCDVRMRQPENPQEATRLYSSQFSSLRRWPRRTLVGQLMPPRRAKGQPLHHIYARSGPSCAGPAPAATPGSRRAPRRCPES